MKHKVRIALVATVILLIIATCVLFTELTATEWSDDVNYETVFQRQMEDALGYKSKKPAAMLKNLEDLNYQLYNKDIERLPKRQEQNRTIMHAVSVERLLNKIESMADFGFSRQKMRNERFDEMVLALSKYSRTKSKLLFDQSIYRFTRRDTSNYKRFHHNIRYAVLYDPEDPSIEGLLHDMATDTIKTVTMMDRGTELKLLITMNKGTKAVFKPMRWGRDHETLPNHYYFNDYERHNAEIAAFHLDRILGFYRVPPVTGRLVNMTSEIFGLAEKALRSTFYVSPIGNLCFYGECKYYCDSRHSFCGEVDMIEGSLMTWLPEDEEAERKRWKSPYRRSYSKFRKATWEEYDDYCKNLTGGSQYRYQRFIPDLIDTHVFDFITGNMDRHHSEIFKSAGNDSFLIHMDNGRGFGKASVDEYSIITPLSQCCQIRKSTFLKLVKLYIGPERLSNLLDKSLKTDPLYPILLPGHLNAADRRVLHVLTLVAKCVNERNSIHSVIIEDGY